MGDEAWRDHQAAEIRRLRALLDKTRHQLRYQRERAELWKQRALRPKVKR